MEKNNNNLNVPNLRFPEFDGEWETHRLGELVEIKSGVSPTGIIDENGLFPFYKVEQLNNCYVELNETPYLTMQSSVPVHGIIFPKRGAAIMTNKIRIASKPCQLDTNLMALIIENNEKVDYKFLFYFIARYNLSKIADTSTIPQINNIHINPLKITLPSFKEQQKISALLTVLDLKIDTQRKIIEDLKKLKDAITHSHYRNELSHSPMAYNIGQYITQVSKRNKDARIDRVLSVSNKYGFINQDEQFEDREVASADTSNYKIVHKGDFAYNPARINVGSVARLQEFENGIVSPMYVCFTAKKGLLPAYFELYLSTNIFKHEMNKRLEGSVRLCLTYESLCNIKIALPEFNVQKDFVSKVSAILTKIRAEERLLYLYHNCKQYLLSQMFI